MIACCDDRFGVRERVLATRAPRAYGVQPAIPGHFCILRISTQHACISEFLSDSIHFMHYQSEFQSDPFQDRRAARTGQEWVELETCAFVCLRETFFPARWCCQQSTLGVSRVRRRSQPSCTVRTVGPDLPVFPGYSLGVLQ